MNKLLKTLTAMIMGVFVLVVSNYLTQSVDTSEIPTGTKSLISVFPLVSVSAVILFVFGAFFGVDVVIQYKRWGDFGNRMKLAYTAKFGGENSGFNEEVDQHIAIMRALTKSSGTTKEIAEDWLKRMAQFVEIAYVIPDEENESEEDKTEELSEEYKDDKAK